MSRTNILLRTNTSGLPGIRPNVRRGIPVIDVTWIRTDGRRGSTSYPIGNAPTFAVERAMLKRADEVGALYEVTPRQAWLRMKGIIND